MVRRTKRTKPSNPTKPTRKKMRGGSEPAAALPAADTNSKNKPADVKADTKATLINENNQPKNKPSTSLSPETESNATNKETEATATDANKETESTATESKETESKETESKEPESKETESKEPESKEPDATATEAKTTETEPDATSTEAKTTETEANSTNKEPEPIVVDVAEAAAAEVAKKRTRTDTDADAELEPELKKSNVAAEAENASHDKCSQGASIFNSVPPECIQKKEVALETIIKNAVNVPIELAKQETADGVIALLESSGNEAIANILMKKALPQLTGPDGKILNEVITDPAVAKEFNKFETNLSGVIGKSLTQLSHKIEEPVNEATKTLVEGSISTATHAAANAPGVGAIVTIGEAVGTANKLKDEATEVMDAVNDAKLPIDTAMKDIVPLSNAIDEAATKAKNAQDAAASAASNATSAASNATSAAASATEGAVAGVNDAASSAASNATSAATSATEGAVAGVNDEASSATGKKRGLEGGSRKRRRIAKLSRRIERTLRRVQKKYGLRDDKNSFLRRTLNAKKMK